MIEAAIQHEPALRVAVFLGMFALVAGWEAVSPRRERWPHNLGLLAFDVLLLRLLAPGTVIAVALAAEAHGWGLFNASALPTWTKVLDRWLRWIVVTPDMHRVHHSVVVEEANSNFGFNVPYWDRLFGTYRAQPAAGHRGMTIGLTTFREPREVRLDRLLLQPFRGMQDRRPDPALRCPTAPASAADGPHAATEFGGRT